MKEKVFVKVKGLQFANGQEEEDIIEVINVGRYRIINGSEYVKYDEVYEESTQKSTNTIKISEKCVEITKKGLVTAHMSFVEGEKTMTFYDTPYGSIYLGIFAQNIQIERGEDDIRISIDYSIDMNYEKVADSHIDIEISSKGKITLE
jgi:uncharacterized beta-barrel protein YwiB (DUF1934 family)